MTRGSRQLSFNATRSIAGIGFGLLALLFGFGIFGGWQMRSRPARPATDLPEQLTGRSGRAAAETWIRAKLSRYPDLVIDVVSNFHSTTSAEGKLYVSEVTLRRFGLQSSPEANTLIFHPTTKTFELAGPTLPP